MPSPRRSSFAYSGSEECRMVFMANGHDKRKNALQSTLGYNAMVHAWVHLFDKRWDHDECRRFECGAFCTLGGFPMVA
ncbi:Kelch motif [Musa troglodytarum]|uniref:Kelch motif n=1 Tax=Musa troglodytarum TaxID=320322 RepID=A0A9E7HIC4_9LILI|nr:Kelch motif [Musa troglodytarum]